MKLVITIAGQDATRLAEHVEQLLRARTADVARQADENRRTPPPGHHRAPRDRRS